MIEHKIAEELAMVLHATGAEAAQPLGIKYVKWHQLDKAVQQTYLRQAHYLIKLGYVRETRLNY